MEDPCVYFETANGTLSFCPEFDGSVSLILAELSVPEILLNIPPDQWLGVVDAMNPLES